MARLAPFRRRSADARVCGYPTDDGGCNNPVTEEAYRCWRHQNSVTSGLSTTVDRTRRRSARADTNRLLDDGYTFDEGGFEFRYNPISPNEVEVWDDDELVDVIVTRGEHRAMSVDGVHRAASAWLIANRTRV